MCWPFNKVVDRNNRSTQSPLKYKKYAHYLALFLSYTNGLTPMQVAFAWDPLILAIQARYLTTKIISIFKKHLPDFFMDLCPCFWARKLEKSTPILQVCLPIITHLPFQTVAPLTTHAVKLHNICRRKALKLG